MAISNDWTIDYTNKAIQHHQFDGTASVVEVNTVTTVADVTNSLDGDYFTIYSATDATRYHVWYNTSGGSATDPAPAGSTPIEVAITTNDTASTVATQTRSAINTTAGDDFTASGTGADVVITNDAAGSATSAIDGSPATSFTFVETTPGQGETVWLVNALYSYIMDTFDESAQMDDTLPMTSQTPTEYTLVNNWFIDDTSIKYLKGGALQTSGWARVEGTGTNIGIVIVPYSASTVEPDLNDIGQTVTSSHADGDTGTLMFFDTTRDLLWIRPDTSAATDSFDHTSGTLTTTTGMSVTQTVASSTGENLWANIFTIGTIENETRQGKNHILVVIRTY